MKEGILLLLFFMSLSSYAQVGINTSNPLQTFHVDGKGNNGNTELDSLKEVQTSDDVVITKDGYLGVGTVNPKARIEINNGTIKIVDGADMGKVLTSNAEGVGTWQAPGLKTITGFLPKDTVNINGNETYLTAYITLSKGDWIVYIGLLIEHANESNKSYATRFFLSNSNEKFFLANTEEEEAIAGYKFIGTKTILNQKSNGNEGFKRYGMFSSGIIRVAVTASEGITLYLWDVLSKNYGGNLDSLNQKENYSLSVGNNSENYIFAVSTQ